jgi:hypothetical protein
MLKIIGSVKVNDSHLQVDEYVPLSFKCFEASSVMPFYWRTGDLRKSLIELKLNRDSGAIFSVTATLLPYPAHLHTCDWNPEIIQIEELPICDISRWNGNKHRDEKYELLTYLHKDSVLIYFENNTEIKTFYKVGRLSFGVDDANTLCLLKFDDLTKTEIALIMNKESETN